MGQTYTFAGVAQLAEPLFCKQQVAGSYPVSGSICGGSSMVERFTDTEEANSSILFRRTIYRYA